MYLSHLSTELVEVFLCPLHRSCGLGSRVSWGSSGHIYRARRGLVRPFVDDDGQDTAGDSVMITTLASLGLLVKYVLTYHQVLPRSSRV
jgi:hypothetical protein